MRNLKFITLIICTFVALSLVTSCSSNVSDMGENTNVEIGNSALVEALTAFNRKTLAETPTTRVSGHTLDVIVEDIYGAYSRPFA